MSSCLILGKSYRGIVEMRQLSENLEIQVTCIEQNTYYILHTEGYEFILATLPLKGYSLVFLLCVLTM